MTASIQHHNVAPPSTEVLDDISGSKPSKGPAKGRRRASVRSPSPAVRGRPSQRAPLGKAPTARSLRKGDVDFAFPSPCSGSHLGSGPGFNPIRGAVVGHTATVCPRQQVAVLPFLVLEAAGQIAWEVHRILRVGTFLDPVDPWHELAPLGPALSRRWVHVTECRSTSAPIVRDLLHAIDLVVGVDDSSTAVLRCLPLPSRTLEVNLARDIPWQKLFGRDFAPLDGWWPDPVGVQSTLRLCALMGLVLELPPVLRAADRPIEYLVSRHRAAAPRAVSSGEMSHASV